MHILVYWHDETRRIIRMELREGWTWDDYGQGLHEVFEQVGSLPHRVDCIQTAVSNTAKTIPVGNPLPVLGSLARQRPPNLGAIYMVDAPGFVASAAAILNQLALMEDVELLAVDSMDTALLDAQARRGGGL